jgi:hypothetical protein
MNNVPRAKLIELFKGELFHACQLGHQIDVPMNTMISIADENTLRIQQDHYCVESGEAGGVCHDPSLK